MNPDAYRYILVFTYRTWAEIRCRSFAAYTTLKQSIFWHCCSAARGWWFGVCKGGGWRLFGVWPSMCHSMSIPSCTCAMSRGGLKAIRQECDAAEEGCHAIGKGKGGLDGC
jgi:hypothetical protein